MKFLSPDWVEQLNRQLQATGVRLERDPADPNRDPADPNRDPADPNRDPADPERVPLSLCVQHIVERADGEALSYWVKVDRAGATAAVGMSDEPTVTFTQSLEVAVGIAQKQRDVHVAFLMGEIKVSGDVMELLGCEEVTAQIIDITSSLNQATDFG